MEIIKFPHTSLRKVCTPVELKPEDTTWKALFDGNVRRLFEIMNEAGGAGLAAPQVDWTRRVFVTDPSGEEPLVFINPKIVFRKGRASDKEGCLSIPGVWVTVPRPTLIVVEAYDANYEPFEIEARDEGARVIMHEYDHLEGILIIDKALPAERVALGLKK